MWPCAISKCKYIYSNPFQSEHLVLQDPERFHETFDIFGEKSNLQVRGRKQECTAVTRVHCHSYWFTIYIFAVAKRAWGCYLESEKARRGQSMTISIPKVSRTYGNNIPWRYSQLYIYIYIYNSLFDLYIWLYMIWKLFFGHPGSQLKATFVAGLRKLNIVHLKLPAVFKTKTIGENKIKRMVIGKVIGKNQSGESIQKDAMPTKLQWRPAVLLAQSSMYLPNKYGDLATKMLMQAISFPIQLRMLQNQLALTGYQSFGLFSHTASSAIFSHAFQNALHIGLRRRRRRPCE